MADSIHDEIVSSSLPLLQENLYTDNYYHQTGITKQISPADEHGTWYYDFVASGLPYTIDVDTSEAADDRFTISVNYRLEDFSNELLGVTGVDLDMNWFAR